MITNHQKPTAIVHSRNMHWAAPPPKHRGHITEGRSANTPLIKGASSTSATRRTEKKQDGGIGRRGGQQEPKLKAESSKGKTMGGTWNFRFRIADCELEKQETYDSGMGRNGDGRIGSWEDTEVSRQDAASNKRKRMKEI